MAGERRKRARKKPASDAPKRAPRRAGPKAPPRTAAAGESRRRKGEAKVVPLHRGQRPRRSSRERSSGRQGTQERRSAKKTVGHGRLRLVVGAVAVVCLSLGARAAQLSVTEDGHYQAYAAERPQQEAAAGDRTGRGSISSADGQRLAMSLNAAEVISTPYQIEDPETTARALDEVLGDEAGGVKEIKAKLTEKNDEGKPAGYSIVAEGVDPEKGREVKELMLPGVSVEPDEVRVYPNGTLAPQLVGHLGADRAYGGVEARYDEELKGGQEVKLTLDSAIQEELEKVLGEASQEYEGKSALGLVMRVEDGAIVALANEPGYDNNDFAGSSSEAQRDRVLTDPYEPGSTFKAFTMAAAIEEGAVTENDTFVVPDFIPVADTVIHDSEPHATEVLTPGGILAHSSNVGTIQVAQRLGGERLAEYIDRFGFGEGTGVDLFGEDAGRVPPIEEWSGTSIGNIPIGQGLTVTPLQLAAGYATLANGGLKVTPHVTEDASPQAPGRRVISERTSSIVRGMLQGVVDQGTGHFAQIPGYTVAGKTGTAQKVDPTTGLYGGEYVTSFVGFAPAQNPKYLSLIVVDEPQKELFGEVIDAPAFQDLMSFALGYYNVPPDRESTKDDPPPPKPTPAPGARKEDEIR